MTNHEHEGAQNSQSRNHRHIFSEEDVGMGGTCLTNQTKSTTTTDAHGMGPKSETSRSTTNNMGKNSKKAFEKGGTTDQGERMDVAGKGSKRIVSFYVSFFSSLVVLH